jgi:hypothetical protein
LPLELLSRALLCATRDVVLLISATRLLLLGRYIHTKLLTRTAGLFNELTGGALCVLLLPPPLPDYTGTC